LGAFANNQQRLFTPASPSRPPVAYYLVCAARLGDQMSCKPDSSVLQTVCRRFSICARRATMQCFLRVMSPTYSN